MRGKPLYMFRKVCKHRITPADAGKTRIRPICAKLPLDHPRGCGENLSRWSSRLDGAGSPPRMRGKPYMKERIEYDDRITPADAGKTAYPHSLYDTNQDHPRGCGENVSIFYNCNVGKGSPPRMRGKPMYLTYSDGVTGITPADAGKTRVEPDYTYVA